MPPGGAVFPRRAGRVRRFRRGGFHGNALLPARAGGGAFPSMCGRRTSTIACAGRSPTATRPLCARSARPRASSSSAARRKSPPAARRRRGSSAMPSSIPSRVMPLPSLTRPRIISRRCCSICCAAAGCGGLGGASRRAAALCAAAAGRFPCAGAGISARAGHGLARGCDERGGQLPAQPPAPRRAAPAGGRDAGAAAARHGADGPCAGGRCPFGPRGGAAAAARAGAAVFRPVRAAPGAARAAARGPGAAAAPGASLPAA